MNEYLPISLIEGIVTTNVKWARKSMLGLIWFQKFL